jgi:putative addiction module CopG family antidote
MTTQVSGLSSELGAALGEHLRGFVSDQVKAGHYRDEVDVLRAALALLESAEAFGPEFSDAEIRELVREGEASGVVDEEPAAFFEELRARYAALPPGKDEGRLG